MKSLNPAIREKKRYLLVKCKNPQESIEKAILDFIGIFGMSKTALKFIKTNKESAIISINRDSVNHVRASLAAWPEKIVIEKVSGTIKNLGK